MKINQKELIWICFGVFSRRSSTMIPSDEVEAFICDALMDLMFFVCVCVLGHAEVVRFLLEACKVNPVPKDR